MWFKDVEGIITRPLVNFNIAIDAMAIEIVDDCPLAWWIFSIVKRLLEAVFNGLTKKRENLHRTPFRFSHEDHGIFQYFFPEKPIN